MTFLTRHLSAVLPAWGGGAGLAAWGGSRSWEVAALDAFEGFGEGARGMRGSFSALVIEAMRCCVAVFRCAGWKNEVMGRWGPPLP